MEWVVTSVGEVAGLEGVATVMEVVTVISSLSLLQPVPVHDPPIIPDETGRECNFDQTTISTSRGSLCSYVE